MLDPRLYRAAFLPVLLAVLVVAFSLEDRPRPTLTTLAPDAYDATRASASLDALAQRFPDRRPGSRGDEELADAVAAQLRTALVPDAATRRATGDEIVRTVDSREPTVDGSRTLRTVIATLPGQPGPGLVVVSERDATTSPARADLSATASMLELARVLGDGRLERSVTFISTSGGTAGSAGAARAAQELTDPVDAVLVLGDVASTRVRKPWIVPWSSSASGQAPLRLRRTLEASIRAETGQDPGASRLPVQWLRQALPLTTGAQGPFLAAGLPAIALSASGERGPAPGATVSDQRLGAFGRAALRTVLALDAGPDLRAAPAGVVVTQRKVLPGWAIRLLTASLLLPVWVAAVDALARSSRRRVGLGRGLRWVAGTTLPVLLVVAFVVALGLTGLLDAPPGALPPGELVVQPAAAVAIVLVAALALALLRPVLLRALEAPGAPDTPGHAAAVLGVLAVLTLLLWLANPFAAMLLVPAAHLWLLAVAPEVRLPRPGGLVLVLLGCVPLALAAVVYAGLLGYDPAEAAWSAVLLLAGGGVGVAQWTAWSVVAGCGLAAGLVAARARPDELPPGEVRSRGPVGYAGPGSLGGTASALRP